MSYNNPGHIRLVSYTASRERPTSRRDCVAPKGYCHLGDALVREDSNLKGDTPLRDSVVPISVLDAG